MHEAAWDFKWCSEQMHAFFNQYTSNERSMDMPTKSNPSILILYLTSKAICTSIHYMETPLENVGPLDLDKEPRHHLVCINDVLFGAVPFW